MFQKENCDGTIKGCADGRYQTENTTKA